MPQRWLQIKGDPSIRRFLFSQTRQSSLLDRRHEAVMQRALKLYGERGVFHMKFHFSSSQITAWFIEVPCNYEVFLIDEFLNPRFLRDRENHDYPGKAVVMKQEIPDILARFGELRFADDSIYLRAASLNIMNGSVGLNFSCDGVHYLDYRTFLDSEQFRPI